MKKSTFFILVILTCLTAVFLSSCSDSLNSETQDNSPSQISNEENSDISSDQTDTGKSAPENTENLFAFEEISNGLSIVGLNCSVEELHIPSLINGKPVIEIGERAFSGCKAIKTLTVEDGVKKISGEAFKNCTSLQTVVLPVSLEYIGYASFNGCSSIKSITLPFTGEREKTKAETYSYPFGYIFGEQKYTGGVETVQYYYYDSLNEVVSSPYCIPSTLKVVKVTGKGETQIPYDAFRSMENLEKIIVGGKVKSIGKFAFSVCYAEIIWENCQIKRFDEFSLADYKGSAFTIPESVEKICRCAFEDCEYLREIAVPSSVKEIDLFAFRGCTRMTKAVINEGVEKLGVNAFYFCTSLKEVSLPASLKEIADSAFMSCKALPRIEIPDGVEIIGKDAFKNCTALKNIVFEEKNGWRYYNSTTSGDYITERTASDSTLIAYYLTDRYRDYIWENVASAQINSAR